MSKKGIAVLLVAVLVVSACLCSCSKETISVTIHDAMTDTILNIHSGATVSQALEEAEISLGEKDEIKSKAVDTKLVDGDEIVVLRYSQVTVERNGKSKKVALLGGTVSDAVSEAGFKLTKKDAVNYDLNAYLTDGMKIVVTRLISITLTIDGKTEVIPSVSCTVGEFLEMQGVVLGEKDIVTPSSDNELTADTKVVVKRVEEKTATETQVIEFNTVYKSSSSMDKGTSKVTQEGKNGEKKVKLRIVYIDGVESEREVLEETVITQPVDKIIVQGTKGNSEPTTSTGKTIVSKQRVDDCDGSGHGYFVITWSDGSVTYEEY